MPPRNNWSAPLYYWTSTDSSLTATTNWGTLTSSVADIVEEISNLTQSMDSLSQINETDEQTITGLKKFNNPTPERMNVSLDEVFEGLSEENKTKINEVK